MRGLALRSSVTQQEGHPTRPAAPQACSHTPMRVPVASLGSPRPGSLAQHPADRHFPRSKYLASHVRNTLPLVAHASLGWSRCYPKFVKNQAQSRDNDAVPEAVSKGKQRALPHTTGLGYRGHAGSGKRS